MKKVLVFLILAIFLTSFAFAGITASVADNSGNQVQAGQDSGDGTQNQDENDKFCGTSTYGSCEINSDCKIGGCSSSVCQSKNEEDSITTCEYKDCYNNKKYNMQCVCKNNKCQWNSNQKISKGLTSDQVKNIIKEQNRLKIHNAGDLSECPNNCTCTGSTTKCQLQSGREMTIQAGNSGNTIVQVKGVQAQTKVQLYKDEEKLYAQFKGNITKRILSPEQIQEKIQERLQIRNCSCENMELDEDGNYEVQTQKQAKLFGLFKVREKVRFKYDAGNGELIRQQTSWWGFLAKDVEEEPIVGATCGTVSPTGRDKCCQNRGYDIYNLEKADCVFSE